MSPSVRGLLGFLVAALPVAVLVLLWASDFFVAWDGRVVSVRPSATEEPATLSVLIATPEASFERAWPAEIVRSLDLPVDAMAIAPVPVPEERPATTKSRFALHFLVQGADGFTVVPTTSPRGLGLAAIVLIGLVAVRNMIVAGAPWAIEPRASYLPPALKPAGQAVPTSSLKPKKGPPPGRPSVGRGRR